MLAVGENKEFQVVLYENRSIVVWNETERQLRKRTLHEDEVAALSDLALCPMCGQTVNLKTFAFQAQKYFKVLEEAMKHYRYADSYAGRRRCSEEEHPAGPTAKLMLKHVQSVKEVNRQDVTREDDNNPFAAPIVANQDAALKNIPAQLLVDKYYENFFVETRALGTGASGHVFLCQHHLDDLELGWYAVKKIPVGDSKDWLVKVLREVKIRENLHHQNIVSYKHSWLELSHVNDFCPRVPWLFVLMEYCDGGDLEKFLCRLKASDMCLSEQQIWSLFIDILSGLQHLHDAGILHRDLKPQNILLRREHDLAGSPTILAQDPHKAAHGSHATPSAKYGGNDGGAGQSSSAGSTQLAPPERSADRLQKKRRPASGKVTPRCSVGSATENLPPTRAVLSDFGTSEILNPDHVIPRSGDGFTGTVEYTAPELLEEDDCGQYSAQYDLKSDMWSLGMVLYSLAYNGDWIVDCMEPLTAQACNNNETEETLESSVPAHSVPVASGLSETPLSRDAFSSVPPVLEEALRSLTPARCTLQGDSGAAVISQHDGAVFDAGEDVMQDMDANGQARDLRRKLDEVLLLMGDPDSSDHESSTFGSAVDLYSLAQSQPTARTTPRPATTDPMEAKRKILQFKAFIAKYPLRRILPSNRSKQLRQLIAALLCPIPAKRPTCQDLMEHTFIRSILQDSHALHRKLLENFVLLCRGTLCDNSNDSPVERLKTDFQQSRRCMSPSKSSTKHPQGNLLFAA